VQPAQAALPDSLQCGGDHLEKRSIRRLAAMVAAHRRRMARRAFRGSFSFSTRARMEKGNQVPKLCFKM
jgi:hypothetical protein